MHNKTNIIFGIHTTLEFIKTQPMLVKTLFIALNLREKRLQEIQNLAKQFSIPTQFAHREKLDTLAGSSHHQGIVAVCQWPQVAKDLKTIFKTLPSPWLFLVLDGVQDPHNLGACLRTANAAEVTAVIAPKDRAAPLNATARKVACGGAEHTPFLAVNNLAQTLVELKEAGVWIVGTADEENQSLYNLDLTGSIALVMGSEEKGLRQLTRKHCDYLAQIPHGGQVSSLNVSVATGICLFEILRQRRTCS